MDEFVVFAAGYFDGRDAHDNGPYRIVVRDGMIAAVDRASAATADFVAAFVMPGLVEAHAHIFLDGGELDGAVRNAYLKAERGAMMRVARANLERAVAAGITVVRDAGDRYGVNDAIRAELAADPGAAITLRSPGAALKRPARYGGFFARDVADTDDLAQAVDAVAAGADDVKVVLTGIIDFREGCVKGRPQFDREETAAIVARAHRRGRKVFAHCSGTEGLEVAVAAGVDSIEHGFFMTPELLDRMAETGIAWVPTFSPVHFQSAHPEIAGWDEAARAHLRRILEQHAELVGLAHRLGVPLVAGSDAGSFGVVHGTALIDELFHFLAAGVPMAAALAAATTRPRRLWGMPAADIVPGNRADLVALEGSPFAAPEALRQPAAVVKGGNVRRLRGVTP